MAPAYDDIYLRDPRALDCRSHLSGLSAYWAVLVIALNTMSQPSGRVLGYPSDYNFFLRSSPVVCAADLLDTLARLTAYATQRRSLKGGLRRLIDYRFQDRTDDQDGSFASLRSNTAFRVLLFVMGALPQLVKIFATTGIPLTKACCAVFLASFVIDEVLMFITSPSPQSQPLDASSKTPTHNTINGYTLDELFARIVVWLNGIVVYGFFTRGFMESIRIDYDGRPLHQMAWSLVPFLFALCFIFFSAVDVDVLALISDPKPLREGTIFALFTIFALGVLNLELGELKNSDFIGFVWLPCLGLINLVVVIWKFRQPRPPRNEHMLLGAGQFYAALHFSAVVMYYALMYNHETTCRPLWTGLLG